MKFDAAWLMDLLEGAPGAEETTDRLTACGFLVELREEGDGGEIWDVEVTTNRPDAMNYYGLAREAALATGATLKPVDFTLIEGDAPVADCAAVEIADPSMCTRLRPGDPWRQTGELTRLDAASAAQLRGPAHQRHRRCHQLCPARTRAAAPRLRSRQGARRQTGGPSSRSR